MLGGAISQGFSGVEQRLGDASNARRRVTMRQQVFHRVRGLRLQPAGWQLDPSALFQRCTGFRDAVGQRNNTARRP